MKAALFYGPANNALTLAYLNNAVNTVKITGGISGGAAPAIGVAGPDANISLFLTAKGANSIVASSNFVANGNIVLATAGKGITVKSGANCKIGTATLVAGTVTVANNSVTAASVIQLTAQNNSGNNGNLSLSINPGVGFTINSSNAADTSTVAYNIFEMG